MSLSITKLFEPAVAQKMIFIYLNLNVIRFKQLIN